MPLKFATYFGPTELLSNGGVSRSTALLSGRPVTSNEILILVDLIDSGGVTA